MEVNQNNISVGEKWDRADASGRARMLVHALSGKGMDQDRLNQLLEAADQHDQIELKLLHNVVVSCMKDCQKEQSASKMKDWEASEKALAKKIELLWTKYFGLPEGRFKDIAAVLEYLGTSGWKVTQTSLYRHQKEGKFLPQPDGTYLQKDIDKYAKTFLKQKSTGKKVNEKTDELQRRKLEEELRILDLDRRRKELALEKDLERFVPREQVQLEMAARAGVLEAGLKHWVQSRVGEWIRAVDGDQRKIAHLINMMNRDLDEHINSYAAAVDFQVVIDEDEEMDPNESEMGFVNEGRE